MGASEKALLPNTKLRRGAREGDILPGLKYNSLVSVGKMAANGYVSIFYPDKRGVEVYDGEQVTVSAEGEPVIRGWRESNNTWRIPLIEGEAEGEWLDCERRELNISQPQINNLYNLPSLEQRVAYIHACLGFQTKAAMLDAAAAGRLVGIPFATTRNIRRFYPETDAMPKGHLDQQCQGVRSTKEWDPSDTSQAGRKE